MLACWLTECQRAPQAVLQETAWTHSHLAASDAQLTCSALPAACSEASLGGICWWADWAFHLWARRCLCCSALDMGLGVQGKLMHS